MAFSAGSLLGPAGRRAGTSISPATSNANASTAGSGA
ncbi:39S ribosomal protein L34, mitochondrial isoform b [Daubentonia madagascariensis]|uniref:39S ribosomal protein L34, mitochondrial isoform b n=1 Tax=Daubentonia madagascariensis TaxID=31869 RepID=A0ABD2D8V0_DAUMA